jgi:glycosyltransferase involved in cell wall biosynthesis
MIVKDEEETIARALMSVKPVVSEMIVIDTGSTDRTKDIAEKLGAKVYDFQWTDSFSDARNFSLSKATGDWILVLDADEVISTRDYGKLKALIRQDSRGQGFENSRKDVKTHSTTGTLESSAPAVQRSDPRTLESSNPAVIAFSFVTRTYVTELNAIGWVGNDGSYPAEEAGTGWFPGRKVRLFPNDSRIRFTYTLHERVEPSLIQAGIEIRTCDVPVHHYGNFVTPGKARSKAEGYYQLGQKKIAESGQHNCMAFYELGLQGAELGKHEEAIQYLKKAIELKPDFAKARQSLGNIYYNLARYDEALLCYQEAFRLDPGERDTVLMYATCEIFAGNAEKSISLIEEFLSDDLASPHTLLLLAEAYLCAGRTKKGTEYVKKLGELKLDSRRLFNNFAKLLLSTGRRDYALSLLDAAGEIGVGDSRSQGPE